MAKTKGFIEPKGSRAEGEGKGVGRREREKVRGE